MLWSLSTPPASLATMNKQAHSSQPVYNRPAPSSLQPPLVLLFFQALTSLGSLAVFAHFIVSRFTLAMRTSCAARRSVNWIMLPLITDCGFHHSCCTLAFYLGGASKDGQ